MDNYEYFRVWILFSSVVIHAYSSNVKVENIYLNWADSNEACTLLDFFSVKPNLRMLVSDNHMIVKEQYWIKDKVQERSVVTRGCQTEVNVLNSTTVEGDILSKCFNFCSEISGTIGIKGNNCSCLSNLNSNFDDVCDVKCVWTNTQCEEQAAFSIYETKDYITKLAGYRLESCIRLYTSSQPTWNKDDCSKKHLYICQNNRNLPVYSQEKVTWLEAVSLCAKNKSVLATVLPGDTIPRNARSGTSYWVGIRQQYQTVSGDKPSCQFIQRYNPIDITYGEEKCEEKLKYICLNDCRIPGKLYKGKKNKTQDGKTCKRWGQVTPNGTEYGLEIKTENNYCRNLYSEGPVCFAGKQPNLMPCDVPICIDNLCVNDEFLQKRYGFLPLYRRLQCTYKDLISVAPSSLLHCGLAHSLVKTIQLKNIHVQCPDPRTMTRALTLQTDDSKPMFQKCYLLENNQQEFLTKRIENDHICLKYLKNISNSETKEDFCRSVLQFANCKLVKLMEVTDETITEYDKTFVVKRLQNELRHIEMEQYNCTAASHGSQSENAPSNLSQDMEDNRSRLITYLVDCKIPGVSYRGTQNMTERGYACQAWSKQYPHRHNYGSYTGAHENYCRDFDSDEPWCLTINRKIVWDRCIVPSCGINVIVNSTCASIDELAIPELKDERSCQSYCNWIRETLNDTVVKENLQNGRTCGINEKKKLIRNKEHLLRRGTFTPGICSISIFDDKKDECNAAQLKRSGDPWNKAFLIVVGIYLLLVIVILLSVTVHRMNKKLSIEIKQAEVQVQNALLDLTRIIMHRELRRVFRRRLARFRSIAHDHYESIPMEDDHYECMPIVDNPYEDPLQRPTSAPGAEYQHFAPYGMHKEGFPCRYCLDQAAKGPFDSFPETEGAHGTSSAYESLQGIAAERPFFGRATSEKRTLSLLNNSPGFPSDHSQSTRCSHSQRRNRRGRKSRLDNFDDDIGSEFIPLQQIQQRNEGKEDAEFISKLLSDVKPKPITEVYPGFRPFQIPQTVPTFRREEDDGTRKGRDIHVPLSFSTGLCIAEIHFDIENTDITDDYAEYLEPKELSCGTHDQQDKEPDKEIYEKLQDVNNKGSISISNALDKQTEQRDDADFSKCFADLENFSEILSEVENMEKSTSEIQYSSEGNYKKLRKSSETINRATEEDRTEDTIVMPADTEIDVCFAELNDFGRLMVEAEVAEQLEQTSCEDSEQSHYDELKIDIDKNCNDDSGRLSE